MMVSVTTLVVSCSGVQFGVFSVLQPAKRSPAIMIRVVVFISVPVLLDLCLAKTCYLFGKNLLSVWLKLLQTFCPFRSPFLVERIKLVEFRDVRKRLVAKS